MSRNAIPKLSEWREGRRYYFERLQTPYEYRTGLPAPDDGAMISYRVDIGPPEKNGSCKYEVLGTCWADGFQECMAAMWESGYSRGLREGKEAALLEIRRALGIKETG